MIVLIGEVVVRSKRHGEEKVTQDTDLKEVLCGDEHAEEVSRFAHALRAAVHRTKQELYCKRRQK